MPYPLPQFLAAPVAIVAMLYLLFLSTLPFLVPYCVWRVLRDIRRIADAMEEPPRWVTREEARAAIAADLERQPKGSAVSTSAFGR